MASENVYGWSTTASTNAGIDGGIQVSEGQLPSTVNNAMRGIMAAFARYLADNNATDATSGSANAYVASVSGTFTANATGLRLRLKAPFTNTGAATLNVTNATGSALGAKSIVKFTPFGEVPLTASNIVNSGLYDFNYDASASTGAGAWVLINPSNVGVPGGTAGGIAYYNTASTLSSSGVMTQSTLIKGGGAGNAPVTTGILVDASNNVSSVGTIANAGNITTTLSQNGITQHAINNANSGASAAARVTAVSNAGTLGLTAVSSAGGGFGGVSWDGAGGLSLSQVNSVGDITFNTTSGFTERFRIANSTGAATFTSSVAASQFRPTASPASAWAFDATGIASIQVANTSSAALLAGQGLIKVFNVTNGTSGFYDVGVGGGNMINQRGSEFVDCTTAPGSGKSSIAFNGGSLYAIYNSTGSTCFYRVLAFEMAANA